MFRELFGRKAKRKAPVGPSGPSRLSEARALDLPKKPYTKALLLWAADHVDQCEAYYRAYFDGNAPRTQALLERIDSGIVIFSAHFTDVALGQLGLQTVFLPTGPLPREVKAILVFAGAIADQLAGLLQAEGFTSDVDALLRRVAQYKMLLHPEAEAAEQHRLAGRVLAELRDHDATNVREWYRATHRIVDLTLRAHIPTATAEDKRHDLPRLYASQLATLLKTVR